MRASFFALLAGASMLTMLGLSSTAWADDDEAATLFDSGMAAMSTQNYKTACASLRKSYRLEKRARTLFYLGECEEKRGNVATAALHYDEYLALFDRLSPVEQKSETEREGLATQRRDALDKDIPRVTFTLPDTAPVGTKVTRMLAEGSDPVPVALGVPLPIDPGEHYVMTEPPGGSRWDKRFFVQKGQRLTIPLQVASPDDDAKMVRYSRPIEPVPALLPPLDPGTPPRRIAAYVIGGVGVAGVVVGIVTGAVTWSQKVVVDSNCDTRTAGWQCNVEGESAADTASATGAASTVAFPVGLACLATAVVLIVTEPKPSRLGKVWPMPQAGIAGRGQLAAARWVW